MSSRTDFHFTRSSPLITLDGCVLDVLAAIRLTDFDRVSRTEESGRGDSWGCRDVQHGSATDFYRTRLLRQVRLWDRVRADSGKGQTRINQQRNRVRDGSLYKVQPCRSRGSICSSLLTQNKQREEVAIRQTVRTGRLIGRVRSVGWLDSSQVMCRTFPPSIGLVYPWCSVLCHQIDESKCFQIQVLG
jgi:hypothetical protein